MKECIIVLGMHRSGTSLLAGLISILGSYTGQTLMRPTKDNPKGYFENRKVFLLNERILNENNSSWDDYDFTLEKIPPEKFHEYTILAKNLIKKELKYAKTIVIKDPRICVLFPVWEKALKELKINIKIILAYRSPMEVALSLATRDNIPLEKGLMLWSHYLFLAERNSRGYKRYLVHYSDDFDKMQPFLRNLSKFTGHTLTNAKVKSAKKFYSPKLKHQNITLENISSELPPYLNSLIELLIERNFDDTGKLDDLYQEYQNSKEFYLWDKKVLEKQLDKQQRTQTILESELKIIHNKSTEQEDKLKALQKKFDKQETHTAILEKQLRNLYSELEELNFDLTQLNEEYKKQQSKLQQALVSEKLKLQELQKTLQTEETLKSKLESSNLSLKNENNNSKIEKQRQLEKINDLVNANEEFEKQISFFKKASETSDELLHNIITNKKMRNKVKKSLVFPLIPNLKLSLIPPFISKERKKLLNERKVIINSGLFSPLYYLSNNPDVLESQTDPLTHYCKHGWTEGRNPSSKFNTNEYLIINPDVAANGMNPLFHYVKFGKQERRRTTIEKKVKPISTPILEKKTDAGKALASIQEISGSLVKKEGIPAILLVAHNAGNVIYGGERSFFDMVEAASKHGLNVIVVLPRKQQQIIDHIKPYANKILVTYYGWWKAGTTVYDGTVKLFSTIIQDYKISLVHVNTIMIREPLVAAKQEGIPSIIHIRELITGDNTLTEMIGENVDTIVSKVSEASDFIVANSQETANAYNAEHKTTIIPNTVDTDLFNIENKIEKILKVGLISSNIAKKGIFEFLEIAKLCKGVTNLQFVLIGRETNEAKKIKELAEEEKLTNFIIAGYKESSLDALAELNIVLNISRFTESFGRTVLEGMAGRRPVIAYKWGALKELIIDSETGYLVPYMDIEAVADKIKTLNNNRSLLLEMGEKARKHAVSGYGFDSYTHKVGKFYNKIIEQTELQNSYSNQNLRKQTISAIIPNYNYELFLPERLNSIINQKHQPDEIIFLDDASTDNSLEVAQSILENSGIPFKIIANKENQGVYKQWLHGISEAKGDWIWLAEADDVCEVDFLSILIEKIHEDINIVFCQSRKIDGNSITIAENNLAHTNDVDKEHWLNDYTEIGVREVVDRLVYRNTIPNASATLLRKSAILGVEKYLLKYKYCGDWLLYAYMLRNGKISFVSKPLNHFRRHQLTVTNQQSKKITYLKELINLREYIVSNFPILPRQKKRLDWFLNNDYKIEGIEKNSKHTDIIKQVNAINSHLENRKRILFITTNNGSSFGGSEMLWQETALKLREDNHDVYVVIKKWDPAPSFFGEFEKTGIKLFFKEETEFLEVLKIDPDLTIISIGDQDEGTEYYPVLKQKNFPYVIINQLTKEERFWPIRKNKTEPVKDGYLNAQRVFFTCWNNHRVMQERLNCEIRSAEIHTNPYHIDRDYVPAYPDDSKGLQIAVPAKILFIHKGQDILVEIMKAERWKKRNITLNFYGDGPDQPKLEYLAQENQISCFKYHGRVADISEIWRKNHAFVLASRMEGLPIMLVSGMLSARVPIVTDIGGHAEVVADGASGFIAKNPTFEALDKAFEQAYQARNEWQEIGQQARQDILVFLPENPVTDFIEKIFTVMGEVESDNTAQSTYENYQLVEKC